MRKPVIVIFILLFLEAVSGCTSPVRRQLDRTEAVMESAPDSALAILDSIDTATLPRASDRALYALLLTQARIKTYEVLTDDSLISTAVSYYEDHGPDSNLMKSLFYQGEILTNNREFSKAIIPSMRAREMAISADNPYWHAKASELISTLLMNSYQSSYSISYIKEAIECYGKCDRQINHRYCLLDLGVVYGNLDKYEIATDIIDSMCDIAREECDSNMLAYGLSAKYANLYRAGNLTESENCYEELKRLQSFYSYNIQELSWNVQSNISDSSFMEYEKYIRDNCNFSSAKDKSNYYNTKIIYFKHKNSPDSIIKYYDSLFSVLNNEVDNALMQSVVKAQKEYSDRRVGEEVKIANNLKNTIFIIIGFSTLIIALIFVFIHQQNRLKRSELENKMKDIIALSSDLKLKEKKLTKLTASNVKINQISETLYRMKWETLNVLCNEYFDKDDSELSRKMILSNIEKEIKRLSDKRSLDEIEKALNKYMDCIMIKLRSQYPGLKEEEFRLLSLVFAGFSSKAICLIFSLKMNSFYSKKRRIVEKIEALDAPDKKLFIRKMK